MKTYYAVISLWISVVLFSNVAVAGNITSLLCDDTPYQSPRIINPRLERINERLSGNFENRFQISYRGVPPSEYRIRNHKLLPGMNTKVQPEPDIKNYYYIATSEATVYDDNGKPITEAKIRAYMISDYKPGCCLLGGVIGSGASFLLGCAAGFYVYDEIGEDTAVPTWLAVWGGGTVASALVGRKAGEEIDRHKAIDLIKEERRTGIKQTLPKPRFWQGVQIGFGVVGAALLIIYVAGQY